MDYPYRLNKNARPAIFLCLSLCIHLVLLFAVPRSIFSARHIASQAQLGELTVTLQSTQPDNIKPRVDIGEVVIQSEAKDLAEENESGSQFAVSNEGISLAVDQHYYSVSELDEHPFAIQDIPSNPPELESYHQGGNLVLRLWINEQGKVVNAEALSTALPQAFIDSARNGFLKARFAPGRIRGIAVGAVMDVELQYAPKQ